MELPPLRIVHCFRSPVGGIFRHVRDLAEAQAQAGHRVGIVCDSSTGGAYEDGLFASIAPSLALGVTRTPMQRHIGPGDLRAAWRTFRILRGMRPDVLHGHGAKGGLYARIFALLIRQSGRRTVSLYTPHGGSLHFDPATLSGRVLFHAERAMERLGDHTLFVSDHERRAFRAKVGEPRVPSSLVFNGLREAEFELVPADPDAADFLYIGMMRDLKGPDLFIDALAETERRTGRRVTAVMVGAGDDLPSYRERVSKLGMDDRIAFHAPMPARDAFRLARVIVVPSRAEAMPYIVLEALAAGMPMIATDVGGIPEIFGDKADVLVSPEVAGIADRMESALAEPSRFRARMPSRASLHARFSTATMAAGIEEAYRASLARHTR
ncbi:MAG: glycosyl transferase [Mesorhizobium amorphae]|nr:MAG: glycosyl transferase [Mesorhizobium amorphae]